MTIHDRRAYDPDELARLGPFQRAAMDAWFGTGNLGSLVRIGPLAEPTGDLRRDLAHALRLEASRIAKIRAEQAYRLGTARYPVPPQLADQVARMEAWERSRVR